MPISLYLQVGAAKSFKRPENWKVTPDERQAKIPILNDIVIQDNGLVASGETLSCQAVFDAANWAIVKGYWINRTMIQVTDHAGNNLGNRRVVVKDYGSDSKFPKCYNVTLEFWNL